jgi:arginyl-tRNA synthetase
VDLTALQSPQAQALMLLLAKYPEMLTAAAQDFAPHDVTFYLRELAACYHSYYDAERILVDDEAVKARASGPGGRHGTGVAQWPGSAGCDAPQKM